MKAYIKRQRAWRELSFREVARGVINFGQIELAEGDVLLQGPGENYPQLSGNFELFSRMQASALPNIPVDDHNVWNHLDNVVTMEDRKSSWNVTNASLPVPESLFEINSIWNDSADLVVTSPQ